LLNNNQIQTIDPQAFQNLPNLQEIHLSGNPIQNIDPQTFQNLPNLRRIWIFNTRIQNIDQLRASLPSVTINF
jgi:Leucine-rich repeat (LRR) protein